MIPGAVVRVHHVVNHPSGLRYRTDLVVVGAMDERSFSGRYADGFGEITLDVDRDVLLVEEIAEVPA